MEKRIEVIGDIEVGGERGRVLSPKLLASSLTSTDYKDPQKTVKRVKKRAIAKPLNPMPDGTCRTIKHQYYKTSIANFMSQGSFGATGVIRKFG